MNKPVVSLVRASSYEQQMLQDVVRLLKPLGGIEAVVKSGSRIIKT